MKITNSFSLNMLKNDSFNIIRERISPDEVKSYCYQGGLIGEGRYYLESCIGHADTASIISQQIGLSVEMNRCTVQLKKGERFVLAQYKGQRLPEGATELPEGAEIVYYICTVVDVEAMYRAYRRLQDVMATGIEDGLCIETAHFCLTGEKKQFSEDELMNMYE